MFFFKYIFTKLVLSMLKKIIQLIRYTVCIRYSEQHPIFKSICQTILSVLQKYTKYKKAVEMCWLMNLTTRNICLSNKKKNLQGVSNRFIQLKIPFNMSIYGKIFVKMFNKKSTRHYKSSFLNRIYI